MLQGTGSSQSLARRLRREMSLPEVLLWTRLRQRPHGYRFRRQHPAGDFVADFYCHEARLVIEVDGLAHDMGDRPARDAERDNWFAARGLEVLRLAAASVLRDPDEAVEAIAATCLSRTASQ